MTNVAVIGGGAAGIGAARTLLANGFDVTLFEAAPRLGGNCVGVVVKDARGRSWAVDAGVSDFNKTTFPECARLLDELGLPTQPIGTDASFATTDGRTVASCRSGRWLVDAAVADAETLAAEVERFRFAATEVLDDDRFAGWTVGAYLDHLGASAAFRDLYLRPRAMGCFPMPDCEPDQMPVRSLIGFWRIHGVVGRQPADRRCVIGGMHRWPAAFAAWFVARGGDLQCGARVLGVARNRRHAEVRCVDRDGRLRRFRFRHVVFANHPHQIAPLLQAPAAEEVAALGRFVHQRARVVVHRDERLVGHDRRTWGAFHYLIPSADLPRVRPTITFHPNRLASLPADAPDVFVTMNPHVEPRADRVVVERHFVHPVASAANADAAARLELLQGRRRTWYAGSYLRSPFVHESALGSGIHAAQLLLQGERNGVAAARIAHGRTRTADPDALSA